MRRLGTAVLVLLFSILPARSQSTSAAISGVITDPTGAAIANAEVTLKLDGGTLLTAIVTNASVRALQLKTGDEAFAAFKASHVILGVE